MTFSYNAADEGRQAESYGEKLIDFIIIQAQIVYIYREREREERQIDDR